MRAITALFALGFSCVTIPHVDPLPRTEGQRTVTSIRIGSVCDYTGEMNLGSAVIISERHAITALHVVDCPSIPTVHIVRPDGRFDRMTVTREDRTNDLALLEISSADRFRINVAPPTLGYGKWGDQVCVATPWGSSPRICGEYLGGNVMGVTTPHGTSGAPAYTDDGHLIGIVIKAGEDHTRLAPITSPWLNET